MIYIIVVADMHGRTVDTENYQIAAAAPVRRLACVGAVGPRARATSVIPANPGLMQEALQSPVRLTIVETASRKWYMKAMANGQVVLVTTEPLDGGSPVRSIYYVAEQDPAKARAIIGAMMAPNERVEAWGPLPEVAVKALGLKPGDFTHG